MRAENSKSYQPSRSIASAARSGQNFWGTQETLSATLLAGESVQRVAEEEEETVQGKFVKQLQPGSLEQGSTPKPNNTGLPENLKSGIENLSGYNMDDVKVHYNSDKPAQLNAHAYAQGSNIHVAPGQEKHLPHEAWHVVQQKQGRVKPTMQLKRGISVNDDARLEKEADMMGERMIVQRMIQNPGMDMFNVDVDDNNVPKTYPSRSPHYTNLTGAWASSRTTMIFDSLTGTTDPANLKWTHLDMQNKNILKDPSVSRDQNLTRLHQIRGKFNGPSEAANMFLGTAKSNNFHSESHFSKVESPIEKFLVAQKSKEKRVEYQVTPNFGTLPQFIENRKPSLQDRSKLLAMIPNSFHCDAKFYLKKNWKIFGGQTWKSTQWLSEDLSTSVGAGQVPELQGGLTNPQKSILNKAINVLQVLMQWEDRNNQEEQFVHQFIQEVDSQRTPFQPRSSYLLDLAQHADDIGGWETESEALTDATSWL